MIAWLNRNPYLALALAGLAMLGGLAARDLLSGRDAPVLLAGQAPLGPGGTVRVHVVGAVRSPGVYELPTDARLEDAITAAGGPTAEAQFGSMNLARHLRDGEQINVAGEAPAGPVAAPPGQLLDLNSATREQLDALPGIGEAYSMRIVASRTIDGPFESVEDLLARNLIPRRTYDAIAAMVFVASQ